MSTFPGQAHYHLPTLDDSTLTFTLSGRFLEDHIATLVDWEDALWGERDQYVSTDWDATGELAPVLRIDFVLAEGGRRAW